MSSTLNVRSAMQAETSKNQASLVLAFSPYPPKPVRQFAACFRPSYGLKLSSCLRLSFVALSMFYILTGYYVRCCSRGKAMPPPCRGRGGARHTSMPLTLLTVCEILWRALASALYGAFKIAKSSLSPPALSSSRLSSVEPCLCPSQHRHLDPWRPIPFTRCVKLQFRITLLCCYRIGLARPGE